MDKKSIRKIEGWSLGYNFLKSYTKIFFKQYYKKIQVFGLENIPYGHPIIFAPNHENALMDPLAILFTSKTNIVFLARADIFKGKRTINFLNFLKILPVYRQRDGVENLAKNEDIFNVTVNVLQKKKPICLMPEGSHGYKHHLRPLVKGMFRIAFSAQEKIADKDKGVMIVPVGLYYGHYVKFNHPLVINYEKPIAVENYFDLYKEKPAIAINNLKNDLADAMSNAMIDIKSLDYYDTIDFIQQEQSKHIKIKPTELSKGKAHFLARKKVIQSFENAINRRSLFMPQLHFFTDKYQSLLKKFNIRDWVVAKRKPSLFSLSLNFLLIFFISPLFFPGYLINIFPFSFHKLITKNFKDKQFHSSVKLLLSIILFPITYIIFALTSWFITHSIYFSAGLLVLSPILGKITLHIYFQIKKYKGRRNYFRLLRKNDEDASELVTLRKKIFLLVEYICDHY